MVKKKMVEQKPKKLHPFFDRDVEQKTVFSLGETIRVLDKYKNEINTEIFNELIKFLNEKIASIEATLQDDKLVWEAVGMDDLVDCPNCEEINEIEFLEIVAGEKTMKIYRCRQCGFRWGL